MHRDWAGVKKLRHLGAHVICLDETGFLIMPVLRRAWAPCGMTPTLPVGARSHEKVSGIGALIVSPRRRHFTLALALYPRGNIRGPQVLRFLRHLARHVRDPFILLWDRGRSHQAALVRTWLLARSSALPRRLVSALRARSQPRRTPPELSQVRSTCELHPEHDR